MEQLIRRIQSGDAQLLERQSDQVGVYLIVHEGKYIKVAYDKQRKVLITALE